MTMAKRPNESWSMDFMSDVLYKGQRIKLFMLVDNYTRESQAIEVAERMGGHRVVKVLLRVPEYENISLN